MAVVVTGGDGTIGQALRAFLPSDTIYLSRHDFDVRERRWDDRWLEADAVIHAGALTDHQHPNAAQIIETNIIGTQHVAELCRMTGRRLVYLSTHYVYPGETGHYRESDLPRPIGTYAWSKFAGEAWAATVPDHCIIRGSWYTYATRLAAWARNGAVVDAWCSREPATSAARKIARLTSMEVRGVINIGGPRRTFAEIAADEGVDAPGIARAQLRGPYPFPADSSVNTEKYDSL